MRISIVTVCLNSVDTIEQTIRSVISQTYPDIEYIIIDGGSTDGTLDIVQKYKDDIAYIVSEPDSGIYNAMNKGISHATGELVGFLNSSDWYISEESVIKLAEMYEKTMADVLYGDIINVKDEKYESITNANVDLGIISKLFPNLHPASLVKKELFSICGFDESYRIAADAKWFLYMWHAGKRFLYVPAEITYFRLGGASSQGSAADEWKRAMLEITGLFIECRYQIHRLKEYYLAPDIEDAVINTLKMSFPDGVYFYGAGWLLGKILPIIRRSGIKVLGLVDRGNPSENYGFNVMKPDELFAKNAGKVLITSELYEDEIKNNILNHRRTKNINPMLFSELFLHTIERIQKK